jgi:hypothetical protein
MTKGIVLLAMGHPYYGQMARNLAVSIRFHDKNIPICLFYATDGIGHFRDKDLKLFTEVRKVPEHCYAVNGKNNWFRVKTFLYDLSPFDETIYLDADMIWLMRKKPAQLFGELAHCDFTIINEAHYDFNEDLSSTITKKYSFWGDMEAIRKAYAEEGDFSTGRLYMMRSEFIYFKKSAANKKYFDLVNQIYDGPKVKTAIIGGCLPDEFAFNIAGCILHHYPHQDLFSPVFWNYMHAELRKEGETVYDNFYAYSIGGNVTQRGQKNAYNNLVKYYFRQSGLTLPWALIDKRSFLTERVKI